MENSKTKNLCSNFLFILTTLCAYKAFFFLNFPAQSFHKLSCDGANKSTFWMSGTVQFISVQCIRVGFSTMQYGLVISVHIIIELVSAQCNPVQYSTAQYTFSTMQYSKVQYSFFMCGLSVLSVLRRIGQEWHSNSFLLASSQVWVELLAKDQNLQFLLQSQVEYEQDVRTSNTAYFDWIYSVECRVDEYVYR